jgi:hypothetical protein
MAITLVYSYTLDIAIWSLSLSSSITLITSEKIGRIVLTISKYYKLLYIGTKNASSKESVSVNFDKFNGVSNNIPLPKLPLYSTSELSLQLQNKRETADPGNV